MGGNCTAPRIIQSDEKLILCGRIQHHSTGVHLSQALKPDLSHMRTAIPAQVLTLCLFSSNTATRR